MTVTQVINDILSLWGIESGGTGTLPDAQTRALNDLNTAIQMIWQNPEKLSYFARSEINVTVLANTGSIALTGIQNVLGPVRITSSLQPLDPIRTRDEYENYAARYFEGVLPPGPPVAYYLDREFQNDEDSISMTLRVVPQPTVNTNITLDVVAPAPEYAWSDYTAGSGVGTTIPLSHGYGESLLLPIARKSATTYYLFFKPERATAIEEQYILARQMLGLGSPEVQEVKPPDADIKEAPWVQRRQR
jgi:hypothetical protein